MSLFFKQKPTITENGSQVEVPGENPNLLASGFTPVVVVGEDVKLAIEVNDDTDVEYQWQTLERVDTVDRNGQLLTAHVWTDIDEVDNASAITVELNLDAVVFEDLGKGYRCVATNTTLGTSATSTQLVLTADQASDITFNGTIQGFKVLPGEQVGYRLSVTANTDALWHTHVVREGEPLDAVDAIVSRGNVYTGNKYLNTYFTAPIVTSGAVDVEVVVDTKYSEGRSNSFTIAPEDGDRIITLGESDGNSDILGYADEVGNRDVGSIDAANFRSHIPAKINALKMNTSSGRTSFYGTYLDGAANPGNPLWGETASGEGFTILTLSTDQGDETINLVADSDGLYSATDLTFVTEAVGSGEGDVITFTVTGA